MRSIAFAAICVFVFVTADCAQMRGMKGFYSGNISFQNTSAKFGTSKSKQFNDLKKNFSCDTKKFKNNVCSAKGFNDKHSISMQTINKYQYRRSHSTKDSIPVVCHGIKM